MTNADKPINDFILTGYSVEAIEGSLAIWGHSSSCISPLVYLRRPKWIKDDACWDGIVKSIMMSLRPNTAVR
jgi:hypothetical protein